MTAPTESLNTGDNTVIERIFLKRDGTPVDLTGASVTISWKQKEIITHRPMAITSATAGVAQYILQLGDLRPPSVGFQFTVTTLSGRKYTWNEAKYRRYPVFEAL